MVDLVFVGLIELAAGALLGWAVSAQHVMPDVLKELGIRHPRRILQAHIDYIIMGVILIAVGLAVPALSTWVGVVLIIGTIVNPALFFPGVQGGCGEDLDLPGDQRRIVRLCQRESCRSCAAVLSGVFLRRLEVAHAGQRLVSIRQPIAPGL